MSEKRIVKSEGESRCAQTKIKVRFHGLTRRAAPISRSRLRKAEILIFN